MLTVYRYREDAAVGDPVPDLPSPIAAGELLWVDAVDPSGDELDAIARAFDVHPLTLEDVSHRRQRPRAEVFERYVFVATHALSFDGEELVGSELHVLAGQGFLVTLSEGRGSAEIAAARARIERRSEPLAREGAGVALYTVLDEVVDGYLDVAEQLEEAADELEDLVFDGVGTDPRAFQERIFRVKRAVVELRRTAAPMRAGVNMLHDEPRLIGPHLTPYLRDLEEHLLRVAEVADAIRDLLTSLLEVRVGQVANDLNEVAKKLSAWAGIILVPTLIAGIYGMNFRHMPELSWTIGYPLALATMALSAWLLHRTFKKRGWL